LQASRPAPLGLDSWTMKTASRLALAVPTLARGPSRSASAATVALLLALGVAPMAVAAPFDVIYSDHMLFLIPPGSTITTATGDFMLFVNKSGSPIGAAELAGLKVTANVLQPSVHVETPILLQGLQAPVLANEVVGALGSSGGGFEDK